MLGTGCWINHIPNQHLAVESENWTAAQLDSTVHVNTNGPGPYLTCRDIRPLLNLHHYAATVLCEALV